MKAFINLIVITFFFTNTVISQLTLHEWKDSYYENYNSKTFGNIKIINEIIDKNNIDYKLFNAAIFYYTNIQRVKHRKIPFKHSSALENAAQKHSENMAKRNFYSHKSPVKGHHTMSDRIESEGITNAYMAENIFNAFDQDPTYWSFAKVLVDGWMDSKGHRANILDKNQLYLGCGVFYYYNKEWEDYFWVKSTQNFSSKKGN